MIEIKVSHAVDEIKKQKIVELRLPCIEVDISEIELDKQKLEDFLLDSADNRTWINNPRMEAIYIQRKREKAEAEKIRRLRLKTEQKQKIQQYKQAHPQYHLLREERCEKCKYGSVQEKFLRWIDSFGEMPEWVSFVKNLTPRQIVEDELLSIEYTHTIHQMPLLSGMTDIRNIISIPKKKRKYHPSITRHTAFSNPFIAIALNNMIRNANIVKQILSMMANIMLPVVIRR